MQDKVYAVSAEIVRIIEETVRESMAPFGFTSLRVRGGEDHDGDPVIFIDADYGLSENPIGTGVTSALITRLSDRLWEAGETRFPHIRHHFDERQEFMPFRRKRA